MYEIRIFVIVLFVRIRASLWDIRDGNINPRGQTGSVIRLAWNTTTSTGKRENRARNVVNIIGLVVWCWWTFKSIAWRLSQNRMRHVMFFDKTIDQISGGGHGPLRYLRSRVIIPSSRGPVRTPPVCSRPSPDTAEYGSNKKNNTTSRVMGKNYGRNNCGRKLWKRPSRLSAKEKNDWVPPIKTNDIFFLYRLGLYRSVSFFKWLLANRTRNRCLKILFFPFLLGTHVSSHSTTDRIR